MTEVVMPRLSDSMEEGTVVRWLVADGERVAKGEPLVEIETDKATMTYEADADGLVRHVAREGDTLPIGAVIAHLLLEGETATAPDGTQAQPASRQAERGEDRPTTLPAAVLAAAPERGREAGVRLKASPVARRIAAEHGLDLAALSGSGRDGRIVKADVEAALAARAQPGAEAAAAAAPGNGGSAEAGPSPAAPAPQTTGGNTAPSPAPTPPQPAAAKGEVTLTELTRLQQVVARRMAESRATVPAFTVEASADMEAVIALRERLKELPGVTPSLNDFVLKACALALREQPKVNGAYRDGRFELYGRVNIGVAVAAEDALVVPTVFDADRKSIGQIAREARALAERVRAGTITPPELSGGTFTVSNLGMYGIRSFEAVINPPQAAILAVGAVEQRPAVRDGRIVARHLVDLRLSCDHRILYGAEAAEFLARVVRLLESPLALAL
ncbi:MAG: 2-oxo acid dehydrogenase subunit E2 [Thermoleophilaceae bacterium]|nr:2-oxo acid dehydrogenase subunit E2 [Thermoleophilaceae bacterium]